MQEPATKSAGANYDNGRLPPTSGHKPSLSKFQIKNSNNHTQLLLGLSVSYHDRLSLQDGRIEDTEFIALDTGVLFEKDNIKLDKFTFAKVAKYLNSQNTMFDSTSISWHIEAGYKRENKIRRFDGLYISGGLGKSTYIGNNLTFLALNLTTSENTIYTDDVGYKILSGLFFDICNNCTNSLTIDMPLHQSDIIEPRLLLNHRYSFDKNLEGRINFIFEEESILSSELSLFYYW